MRTSKAVLNTFKEFDETIGLKELCVLHINDSKEDLNANKEQHEHIGLDKIGNIGFKEILKNKFIQKIPIIMETPIDHKRGDVDNFRVIKNLIKTIS